MYRPLHLKNRQPVLSVKAMKQKLAFSHDPHPTKHGENSADPATYTANATTPKGHHATAHVQDHGKGGVTSSVTVGHKPAKDQNGNYQYHPGPGVVHSAVHDSMSDAQDACAAAIMEH
jgi:hypothetical protein